MQGVYVITNTRSNKKYVGSSVNVKKRLSAHKRELRKGTHCCAHLQRSWSKGSEDLFTFDILEEVKDVGDLIAREQYWMDTLRLTFTLFNTCPKAASPLGMRLTIDQRNKISAAHKGKPKTAEHRAAMKEGAKTRVRTQEEIDQWRFNRLGKSNTKDHIEKARSGWLKTVGSKSPDELEAWAQATRRRCSVNGVEYKSVKEACEMSGLYKQKLKAQPTFKYL
jgi:group I intron endonuclease